MAVAVTQPALRILVYLMGRQETASSKTSLPQCAAQGDRLGSGLMKFPRIDVAVENLSHPRKSHFGSSFR